MSEYTSWISYFYLFWIYKKSGIWIAGSYKEIILKYLNEIQPNSNQLKKINYLRFRLEKPVIKEYNLDKHTITLESIGDFIEI